MEFLNPQIIATQLGITKGMAVADFGCGAGYFPGEIARLVGDEGHVAAIDIQQSALESVRSRARQEHLLNIEPIWGDLEVEGGSQLKDASQDMVLIANVLHQAPDKAAIIREARRVLKPRGRVVIIDWNMDSPLGPARERRVPKSALTEMAAAAGLKPEQEFSAGQYHYGMVLVLS